MRATRLTEEGEYVKPALVFDWHGTLWRPDTASTPDPVGLHPTLGEELKHLQKNGVDLAIISNTDNHGADAWIRKQLAKEGLLCYFTVVVSSADVGVHKPDPHIFFLTARFLKRQYHNIIMVGDSKHADGGAAQVGWKFKHVPHGHSSTWIPKMREWTGVE